MEFENVTRYDRRAMLALNLAAAGAQRPWLPLVSHGLGLVVSLLFFVQGIGQLSAQGGAAAVASVAFGGVLLVWSLFLFHIRAWMTATLLTKNSQEHRAHFDEAGFAVTNSAGTTQLGYDGVWLLVQTKGYYVLLLDKRHGYVVDKDGFTQGERGAFQTFLCARTGKNMKALPLV